MIAQDLEQELGKREPLERLVRYVILYFRYCVYAHNIAPFDCLAVVDRTILFVYLLNTFPRIPEWGHMECG